jgi:hypothetical protein
MTMASALSRMMVRATLLAAKPFVRRRSPSPWKRGRTEKENDMTPIRCFCVAVLLAGSALPAMAQSRGLEPADPTAEPRVRVAGRLVLPWGRHDESRLLVLALRNDSRNSPRAFKVVFFSPSGEPTEQTEMMPLPPKASVVLRVDELIDPGAWQAGSIEIHYRGLGGGRLFGTARQVDLALAQSEIQPLWTAQFKVLRYTTDE